MTIKSNKHTLDTQLFFDNLHVVEGRKLIGCKLCWWVRSPPWHTNEDYMCIVEKNDRYGFTYVWEVTTLCWHMQAMHQVSFSCSI